MKKYDTVLIDMDGTICNTEKGITNTIKKVLFDMGVFEFNLPPTKYIGPPLVDTFYEVFLDKEKAKEAVSNYRALYKTKGVYENELYNGMYDLIVSLKKSNYKIALASLKPEIFCLKVLKQHNLLKYFDYISCATLDGSLDDKTKIINIALNNLNAQREKTIMIGDTIFDLIGAKENNIDVICALYGYGDKEILLKEDATFFAKDVEDIKNFLL